MPWKECKALDERKNFIREWEKGEDDLAELCRRFGVSRPTAYTWLKRYEAEGEAGLEERSRSPHECPHAMSEAVMEAVLKLRREHPRWGPRKLRAYLMAGQGQQHWPAASSIGALLSREGLAHRRHVRRRTPAQSEPLAHAQAPNQVWCADYKGWFYCGDGQRCDPLTISDAFSRYLLRCRAVPKTDGVEAKAVFEAVFREYGTSASSQVARNRTGGMSGCIRPSNRRPPHRREATCSNSSKPFKSSSGNTTRSVRMRLWSIAARPNCTWPRRACIRPGYRN